MSRWKRWWIPAASVLAAFLLIVWRFGLFSVSGGREALRILSDGFFISGALAAGVGAVSWASGQGTFDMLGYGMRAFLSLFTRDGIKKLPKSYYDYKEEKSAQSRTWLWETLVVGMVFVLVGAALLIAFSVTSA